MQLRLYQVSKILIQLLFKMNTWQIYEHHMLLVNKIEPFFPNQVKVIARSSCTNTTNLKHLNNSLPQQCKVF